MIQPIPTPQVLDPDRVLANDRGDFTVNHEAPAALLNEALHATCSYAEQLWHDLDAMRGYLLTSLPPDPRTPGLPPTASASPTGPDDADGWDNWIAAYAAVTSVLCGPQGDSGYGLSEARREADLRRTAPVLARPAHHPDVFDRQTAPASTPVAQTSTTTRPSPHRASREPSPPTGPHRMHTAATVVLAFLALRGLRTRRPNRPTGQPR